VEKKLGQKRGLSPNFVHESPKFLTMKLRHIAFLLFLMLGLGACKGLRELKNLTKCQFRIGTVQNINLAGVNIQTVRRFADLGVRDAAKVGTALAGGNLPLGMTINVEVKNPNKNLAAMNRMEWIALIDDREILTGIVSDRVEVAPEGGVANLPLTVSTNLRKVLGSMGKNDLLDFGMGLTDQSNRPTRVSLKIKPTIMVGKHPLEYPGWFTVKREFTSQ
jgi:hypothetical protein